MSNFSRYLKWVGFLLPMTVYLIWPTLATGQSLAKAKNSFQHIWASQGLDARHYTGLIIKDYVKDQVIFSHRADNLFTPASNMKLLTMYASLLYLSDRVPAAYFHKSNDTLFLWGGADPGVLYKDPLAPHPLIDLIRNADGPVVFSDQHFTSTRFGNGWAWNDNGYNFQCERNPYPIYGNRLWIDRHHDTIQITPAYYKAITDVKKDTINRLSRNEWGTYFLYQYQDKPVTDKRTIPVALLDNDVRFIWQEVTGKPISFQSRPFINAQKLEGSNRDTLIRIMMQDSDNFISEHLLLACAMEKTGVMNEEDIIEMMMQDYLSGQEDKMHWVDGSGLSRYNQLSPVAAIFALEQIIALKGMDYTKSMMAAGGYSGTLSGSFPNRKGKAPYVFAKTGTMRNIFNVTGILITDSGKVLTFSWMNNAISGDGRYLRESMEKLFAWLRDNY